MNTFTLKTPLPFSQNEIFKYHQNPGALERLIPPWEDIKVISRTHEKLEEGSEVTLHVPLAPGVKKMWVAKHIEVTPPEGFVDTQLKGPFAYWKHHHRCVATGDNTSELIDEIHYKLPFHFISKYMVPFFVKPKLQATFSFRHKRTELDITRANFIKERTVNKVLIIGASGLVGSELKAFLEVSGYEVFTVSRSKHASERSYVWNVKDGIFPIEALEKVDAVIHLAGEGIANKPWSKAQKEKILKSRIDGTKLLVQSLAKTENKPKVLISASAIGFYGLGGEQEFTEESPSEDNAFLSDVAKLWEDESNKAAELGIRTITPRIGLVLSPKGGALRKMLPAFKLGVAGRLGGGNQWMSWIGIDDLIYGLHTVLEDDSYSGPVNFTAPNPVRNSDFTATLAKVLRRPAFLPVPGAVLKLALGQMADELLLGSVKVIPEKLEKNGFTFSHPDLESNLRYQLGR